MKCERILNSIEISVSVKVGWGGGDGYLSFALTLFGRRNSVEGVS